MNQKFATLCQELGLSENFSTDALLTKLKNWCFAHISQDMRYDGSLEKQYLDYYHYAQRYFNFLAFQNDLTQTNPDLNQFNPIQYASYEGYHFFLSQYANAQNVNLATPYQMTPLHLAATSGHFHTVEVLLENMANPNALNNQGEPPIFSALFLPMLHRLDSIEQKKLIFKLLVIKAPNTLSLVDKDGNTILHLIAPHSVFAELLDLVVLQHPELTFKTNHLGLYPIHLAILNHSFSAVQSLLNIPGMSDVQTPERQYPIHLAARIKHPALIDLCFKSNPSLIDAPDETYKTPLLLAAEVGNTEGVATLIQLGANPNVKDLNDKGIVDYAINFDYPDLQKWLMTNGFMSKTPVLSPP